METCEHMSKNLVTLFSKNKNEDTGMFICSESDLYYWGTIPYVLYPKMS